MFTFLLIIRTLNMCVYEKEKNIPTVNHGGGLVMFWECISESETRAPQENKGGRMEAGQYQRI